MHNVPGSGQNLQHTQSKADSALNGVSGVKFFVSSCTATTTKNDNDETSFGVAYFIVAHKTDRITPNKIFDVIYDQGDLDITPSTLKTRNEKVMKKTDAILSKLKQVVKVIVCVFQKFAIWKFD